MTRKIITDKPLSGRENMDRDRDMLRQAESFSAEEYLVRIYEWSPPAISLGISQKEDILDLEKLNKEGIEIIHRITGGKAVIHRGELTYAVAAPVNSIYFGGSLHESYHRIAGILMDFLKSLKVSGRVKNRKDADDGRSAGPVCFDTISIYEISTPQGKLIGSAQKRGKKAFLQHGSIPVTSHQNLLYDYLPGVTNRKKSKSGICLRDLGVTENIPVLKDLLKEAFLREIKNTENSL